MPLTIKEIAQACGLEVLGGDPGAVITAAANIQQAGPGELSFIARESHLDKLAGAAASAVVVPRAARDAKPATRAALLLSDDPEMGFIRCLRELYPAKAWTAEISARASVDPSARIGEGSRVEAFVSVGANSRIGRDCRIMAGCVIGDDVEIGDGCTLYPRVVLYDGVVLRDSVMIHAGAVIGADGYGYKYRDGVHVKFPQVGGVLIEEDVEIGANTCIDRAALGLTRIGAGTKIDNQVHIAHNVQVGRGALILGQTGIGGSAAIGDYAILASQCGVADHVTIGRGAKVLAQAGVIGDVACGDEVMGFPASNRKQALREMACLRRLAELYKPLRRLVDQLPGGACGKNPAD